MIAPHPHSGRWFASRRPASAAGGIAALAAAALWGHSASAQTVADFFPEVVKLIAPDGLGSDMFGRSTSIDGDTLVVGALYDTVTATNQGSAYVFERQVDGSWLQSAKLLASDAGAGDRLGQHCAIEGDTIVVGAYYDDGTFANQGSAYVFERQANGTWLQTAKLVASDGALEDQFGTNVSISADRIVVGAPLDDTLPVGDHGSAYVFERQSNGTWVEIKLLASDGLAADRFGTTVAIDGDRIVVGALYDDGTFSDQGSVYVFERQANGSWPQVAKLVDPAGVTSDLFGSSVTVDDGLIVTGAMNDDAPASNQGSAVVFERQANGSWLWVAKLVASDGAASDQFGEYLCSQSGTIVVAARRDDAPGVDQGSVYVFERQASGSWLETAHLFSSDGEAGEFFGFGLSMDAGTLVFGAPYDTVDTLVQRGSTSIFEIRGVAQNLDAGFLCYDTLAEAIDDALPSERIAVRAQALQVSGTLDASSKPLTFVAVEPLTVPSATMLRTADGTAFVKSPDVSAAGLAVGGTLFAPPGETLVVEDISVIGSGRLLLQGATLLVYEDCRTANGGICDLSGHVLADVVSTDVGGQNRVSANTDIFCNYTNAGSTSVESGTLYIHGDLNSTGTMSGDATGGQLPPAAGDGFNIGGNNVVGAAASLTMPSSVWWLRVGGNLDIAINAPARFVMDQATIELTGLSASPSQTFEVMSSDLGAVMAGFATTNYPISALRLRAGAVVNLADARDNATGAGAEAIYAHTLVVPAGATLVTGGRKVYVESATINGTVSNPSDVIIVTAAPPCIADISGDGVVNGQDLGVLLVMWGPCGAPCPADINTDGAVNGLDLGLMLTGWGSCSQ